MRRMLYPSLVFTGKKHEASRKSQEYHTADGFIEES